MSEKKYSTMTKYDVKYIKVRHCFIHAPSKEEAIEICIKEHNVPNLDILEIRKDTPKLPIPKNESAIDKELREMFEVD